MRGIFGAFRRLSHPSVSVSPSFSDDDLIISFDGRIDDRASLAAELSLPLRAADEALVAAAYRRWRDDFLAHILGDFSLAVWDARAERLLLTRDFLGVYPLYYHRTPDTVTWSSRLQPLLDATGCDRSPDPHFAAGFLTRGGGRLDVSQFAAIAAVPPATFVVFDREQQTTRRWWRLDPERTITLRSDAAYEERFRETFRAAVADRLRGDAPVFADLSGGVDSTSVVAVADEWMRHSGRPRRDLQTVSYLYDAVALSDDRPYLAIAEKAFGRTAHHVDESRAPILGLLGEEYPFDGPTAFWGAAPILRGVAAVMAAEKSSVLLCGAGGDHLCYSEVDVPPYIADHLASFRFGDAMRASRDWAGTLKISQTRILRRSVRNALAVKFRFAEHDPGVPPWIDRRFARQTAIDRPSRRSEEVDAYGLPSRREQLFSLRDLATTFDDRNLADSTIDVRYPFADRRMVELAYGIPLEQHLRPGETRSLQRRAMTGLIPAEIAQRRTKGGPSVAIYHRFRQRWRDIQPLLRDLRVCAYGWIDRDAVTAALHRAAHGQNTNATALLRVLAMELWLRKLERPAAAADEFGGSLQLASGRR